MHLRTILIALAALGGGTAPAAAAVFSEQLGQYASFTPEGYPGFTVQTSLVRTGDFASGTVLSGADKTGYGPAYFDVTLDTIARTITLTVREPGNYDFGYLDISGITGPAITGLSTVSYTDMFANASFQSNAPQLSFTGSSLRILFQGTGSPNLPNDFYFVPPGQAVFSYTVAQATTVPEPATWALMIGGFGAIGGGLRRRRATLAMRYS